MPTELELTPVKFISTKRKSKLIYMHIAVGYEYVPHEDPMKEEAQFYEDYLKAVELEFGANKRLLRVFDKLHRQCKQGRCYIEQNCAEMRKQLRVMSTCMHVLNDFSGHRGESRVDHGTGQDGHRLSDGKYQTSRTSATGPLQYSSVTDCRQLIVCLLLASQIKHPAQTVYVHIHTRATYILELLPSLTWKTQVLQVLGNRNDLIEAYMEFVPEAQKFRSTGKFLPYPVIGGLLVAFAIGSAIGLSKIKK